MTSSVLEFDNTKTLIIPFIPLLPVAKCQLDVDGQNLIFKTTSAITIPAAEIIQIDCIPDTQIDLIATNPP